MEILVVTWNFPPRRGGIEYLISNLCDGLKKKHSVFVITAHASSTELSEDQVFRAPWPGLAPFALYALRQGGRLLHQNPGINVVFGGSVVVTPLVLILARWFRRKAIVQAHGLDLIYRNSLYQFLSVRWIKFCDRIVANSSYTASLAQQKGAQLETVSVIHPGVDADRFAFTTAVERTKQEWGLEGKRIILFVGRLARRKGVKEFIQMSLPKIAQEIPDACFVIAGGNPTESLTHREDVLGEVGAAISETQLQKHIRLLGPLADDELIKLYQACDLVVLPAVPMKDDVEGFGIVLLEAAAAAKPAVATRVGGIPDAVEHGKSGVLIKPGDYEMMSRTIVDLLQDDRTRRAMGEYARNRVRETFGWEMVASQLEAVLSH